MTKLRKSELQEMTTAFMLANTPKSLLRALLKTKAVSELRQHSSPDQLLSYYEKVTEKGERSPFVAALAYSTLIALLTSSSAAKNEPDPSRLEWGPVIADYLAKGFSITERRIFTLSHPAPRLVNNVATPSVSVIADTASSKKIITI